MATITLTIPDAQLPRVIAALCARPLPPVDPTGANAKLVVVNWIKECVFVHEHRAAEQAIVIDTSTLVT